MPRTFQLIVTHPTLGGSVNKLCCVSCPDRNSADAYTASDKALRVRGWLRETTFDSETPMAVDMLIGSDFYWQVRQFEGNVVLWLSTQNLGWVLSGPAETVGGDKPCKAYHTHFTSE